MKKYQKSTSAIYLMAAMMLGGIITACNDGELTGGSTEFAEKTQMVFKAEIAPKRTILQPDNSVYWEEKDAISLFDPIHDNNYFVTTQGGASVTFSGEATSSEGTYHALYPYNEKAQFDGNHITTELPWIQTARAGSFSQSLNPAVATADANRNLVFNNVCAVVKFTLNANGHNITKATLAGNNGEHLAGTLQIDVSSPEPVTTIANDDQAKSEVELNGTLNSSNAYYFVAAPTELTQGLTLTLYNDKGQIWQRKGNNAVTLSAGRILNLNEIKPDQFAPADGYEKDADGVYHIYNATGLLHWASQTDCLTSNVILENDIDMTGLDWTPLGTNLENGYSGTFDGNSKTIKGLTINSENGNVGFFATLATYSKVKNAIFTDASVKGGSGSVTGVVAGTNLGIIDNCDINNSIVWGLTAGGITGNNSIQVINCNVSNINVNTGFSAGNVGGIAGISYGKIEYCTVSGNSTISANVPSGNAGGIVGSTSQEGDIPTSGRLLKCAVSDITISGVRAGGIVGVNQFGVVAQCVANRVSVTNEVSSTNTCLGGVVGYNSRGNVIASYSAYSSISYQHGTAEGLGGIIGTIISSESTIYGCYSTNVSFSAESANTGAIVGHTAGSVISCYAISSDNNIKLIGSGQGQAKHCVEIGETNFETLIDKVSDLVTEDGTVWKASEIWNITASGYPTIQGDYIGNIADAVQ